MCTIYSGDDVDVLELILTGADVDIANREGWTPLHLAARDGDFKFSIQ